MYSVEFRSSLFTLFRFLYSFFLASSRLQSAGKLEATWSTFFGITNIVIFLTRSMWGEMKILTMRLLSHPSFRADLGGQ